MDKVVMKPRSIFQRNGNNSMAVEACKKSLQLRMIGIGGADISKGVRKLVLSSVY